MSRSLRTAALAVPFLVPVLLLATPSEGFEKIVPWLIGGASVAILVQRPPRELAASGARAHPGRRDARWLPIAIFVIAIYGGYFGAAAGTLMLATFLLTTGEGLPRSNAMRNVVLGVANGVAAVGFVLFASVAWSAALPLAGRFLDMPAQQLGGDLYTPNMHWGANGPSERMVVSPGRLLLLTSGFVLFLAAYVSR